MSVDDPRRVATFASYVPRAVLRRVADAPGPPGPAITTTAAALLLIDIGGFTPLTASAAKRGPAGTEALWVAINGYLGRMVDLVLDHGGDIAKIVGDALVVAWPATEEELPEATRRAAACAWRLAAELGEADLEDGNRLSIRIGLSAGSMAELHLGGRDDRWLFLVAGDALEQLARLGPHMPTGALVASPEAWSHLRGLVDGEPLADGHVVIRSAGLADPGGPSEVIAGPVDEPAVRGYIPRVSEARIEAGHGAWLAEVRRTSVAFVAIRGLGTADPATLDAFEAVARVGQHVVGGLDGWLKELTVDEKGVTLVAVFGVAPHSHEDDPTRAVEAAAALTEEIGRLGLRAGAGVATGPAICGPVGNERRRDFAVLGLHVNLAARLAQEAADGVVLSDDATHDADHGRRAFDRLAAYVLKGLDAPVDVYRLSTARAAGDRGAIIGRSEELAAADRAAAALAGGVGGLFVVEGEPGIGKSTFVAAWVARAGSAGARTLVGEATEIQGSTPYHGWRSALEAVLGIDHLTDRGQRRDRALEAIGRVPNGVRMAPLLDAVLALDIPADPEVESFTSEVRADHTRDLLIHLLAAAAADRPTMIVIEDVHWLDSASWALVHRAAREIPTALLVLTSRPGGADEDLADLADLVTRVPLAPLSRDEALALACARTGATSIADPVAAIVDSRAEGNPLFIEQLTFAMRDAGRIVVQGGTVRPTDPALLDSAIIPDTIQRVLTTRMDQLPPGEALTLKVASVIGDRFDLDTLLRVYPVAIDEAGLRGHVDALARLDLVRTAASGGPGTFEFRHVIAREVAYNLMLSSQARELHRAVAEWHDSAVADDPARNDTLLAHHWQKAGEPARAIDHLELAAARSLRTFANDEAIEAFGRAIDLAAEAGLEVPPRRQASWHLGLGEAHVHLSQYRDGRDHLELGLRLTGQAVPRSRVGQVALLGRELIRQGFRRLGLRRTYRLDERSRSDLVAALRAYERLAEASFFASESILPLYCVVRVLNEGEKSGIPSEIARGFAGSGALLGLVPAPRVARWYLDRAMARLAEVDDLTTHEIVEQVVGFYEAGVGHWEGARDRFGSESRIARRLGDRRRLDDALSNLMEVANIRGAYGEAITLATELVASASARGDRRFEADGLVGLTSATWHRGDATEASLSLQRPRQYIDAHADVTTELRTRVLGLSALVSLDRDDPASALAASAELMLLTDTRPTNFGTFIGYVAPAEVYLAFWESGQPMPDLPRHAARAVERLKRYGGVFPIGRPRAATLEGRRQWLAGNRRAAIRSWQRALTLARDLDMDYEEGLAHLELGRRQESASGDRATHLGAAIELFGRLDAGRALRAASAAVDDDKAARA